MSKWYQSLDDKSVFSICSLRVSFRIDLSFSEMIRFYSPKPKKACNHRQRKNREELERVREKNFKNSRLMSQILIVKGFHFVRSVRNLREFVKKSRKCHEKLMNF